MGRIVKAIEGVREKAAKLPGPEELKQAISGRIQAAKDRIRGSDSVPTELKKTAKDILGMPLDLAGNAFKMTGELLTLQPIKATKRGFKYLIDTMGKVTGVITSPIPTGIAAAKTTFNAGVEAIKFPPKTALKAFHTVSDGVNGVLDLYGPGGGGSSATPKSSDAPAPAPAASPAPAPA